MNSGMNLNNYSFMDNGLINDIFINNNQNYVEEIYDDNNLNIIGTYEGYLKGNMFKKIYDGYKKYKPAKLIPNNEQAEILLNLNQVAFAAHDIRLYLDIHPDDKKMINLFNQFQNQANIQLNEYEKKYGPIMINSLSENNMFSWEIYNFPWEKEEL